jgi:hypothetical protein
MPHTKGQRYTREEIRREYNGDVGPPEFVVRRGNEAVALCLRQQGQPRARRERPEVFLADPDEMTFSTLHHLYLADGPEDAFEYRGQVQVYERREATQTELNEASKEVDGRLLGRRTRRKGLGHDRKARVGHILYLIPIEEPRPSSRGRAADFLQHWAKTAPHEWEHKVNYLYERIRHQIIRGIYRDCISLQDRNHSRCLSWPLEFDRHPERGRLQVWFRLNQQIEAGALDQMLRAVLTEVHPEMRVELFLERERPGLAPATEVFGYDPAEFPPQQQHV